jgi:hypothetical protein
MVGFLFAHSGALAGRSATPLQAVAFSVLNDVDAGAASIVLPNPANNTIKTRIVDFSIFALLSLFVTLRLTMANTESVSCTLQHHCPLVTVRSPWGTFLELPKQCLQISNIRLSILTGHII